jgi:hypothetical protein
MGVFMRYRGWLTGSASVQDLCTRFVCNSCRIMGTLAGWSACWRAKVEGMI